MDNSDITNLEKKLQNDNNKTPILDKKCGQILDNINIPIFVINNEHSVVAWNHACELLIGIPSSDIIGTKNPWRLFYPQQRPVLADLVVDNASSKDIAKLYGNTVRPSSLLPDALEGEDFFPSIGKHGRWFFFMATPLYDEHGTIMGAIETVQDITERHNTMALLKENEQKLASIMATIPEIVYRLDAKGYITFINDAVERYGYIPEELIGRYFLDIVCPGDRDKAIQLMEERRTGDRKTKGFEIHLLCDEQSETVFNITSNIIQDKPFFRLEAEGLYKESERKDKIFIGTQGIARDITEEQKAREKLKKSQERLSLALSGSEYGIWDWDIQTGEVFVNNDADIEQYEVRDTVFTYEDWRKRYHPDDLKIVDKEINEHLKGKSECFEAEYRMKSNDNEWEWRYSRGNVVEWSADGEPLRMCGTYININERKRAQLALLENERKYRSLFESAIDAIFVMKDDIIIDCNPSALRLFGYTKEEIVGKSPVEFSPKLQLDGRTSTEMAKKLLKDAYNGNRQFFEWIHQKKDGTFFHADISLTEFVFSKDKYLLAILRDNTERKSAEKEKQQLETQLRQAQKMEAIGTLAGGIAHDFNNILSPIIGYCEMSINWLDDIEEVKENLKEVLRAAERAKELVGQILTFSRQKEEDLQPLNIIPVIKEAVKLLRSSIPSTIEIQFETDVAHAKILCDPTQIHQIVMNLCTNAYHAMYEKGGELSISLTIADISMSDITPKFDLNPGSYAVLSVNDTGKGMDNATMGKIFDPYYTTKPSGEGTGLGLSVVHGIVKKYGGTISVYSEPGKGSAFKVYLPIIETKDNTEPRLGANDYPGGNEHILYVDDEISILQMIEKTLPLLSYRVTTFHDSQEALAELKQKKEQYDLVITDQVMPNMDGLTLAKKILEMHPAFPIIICTGFSDTKTQKIAQKIGIRKILYKPLIISNMSQIIRNVLDNPG